MPNQRMLAKTLIELADTLVKDFDVVELLTRLADRCVEVLEVDAAGLMLAAPDGNLRVIASSSETMRLLELFEVQAQEGPCLDCYRTGMPVVNLNLTSVDGRWPRFAAEARDAGFQSVHALPMRLRSTVIGALNMFHVGIGQMPLADLEAAQAFADVATIAILQHRATREIEIVNTQLNDALTSRIVIEQAKGMIAQQQNIDMEEAFLTLRNHARNHNLRLLDLAQSIIDAHPSGTAVLLDPSSQTTSRQKG